MERSMERIPKRRDTGVTHPLSIEPDDDWLCDEYWGDPEEEEEEKKRTQSRTDERKAVKIGRILQSYGHTQRDETKEQRDGWNCI
jgi:hypothetical protein